MRPFLPLTLILASAATPAAARDGAWYVGGDFGAMIVEDVEFDIGSADNVIVADHDYGFDGALFVGYDLGAFRLEAEVSYRAADLDSFENSISLPNSSGSLHPPGDHDGGGDTSALSFMINGMLDFGDDDGISGFVGGGVGLGRVRFENFRALVNDGEFIDDSDSRFAWQIIAGLRHPVSDTLDVHIRYRFFNVNGLDIAGWDENDQFEGSFRSHSLLAGITFNFDQPAPPPPPPPSSPPPPPPPPPAP